MKGKRTKTGRIAQIVAAERREMSTPRWVWKDDSPTGRVLVCGPLRISAKRNSFQLRMKGEKAGGQNPGRRHGQGDAQKGLQPCGPVDPCRLLQQGDVAVEERHQQPGQEGQADGQVSGDQAGQAVEQRGLEEEREEEAGPE